MGPTESGRAVGDRLSAWNELWSDVGTMRIPLPPPGTTQIVPHEIPWRIIAWTSGRWAVASKVSHREPVDSGFTAASLSSTSE
jgi:hypothetical protein